MIRGDFPTLGIVRKHTHNSSIVATQIIPFYTFGHYNSQIVILSEQVTINVELKK